jgi:hypothetical protein
MSDFSGIEDNRYNVMNTEFILHFTNVKLSCCHPFWKCESSLKRGKSWFIQEWISFTKKYSYFTSWSRVLFEKLTGSQLVKKFPVLYGTRKFITALTSDHDWSLSWARSIHSTPPHRTSCKSISILLSHLRLGLSSGSFPSVFAPKLCRRFYSPLYVRRSTVRHLMKLEINGNNFLLLSLALQPTSDLRVGRLFVEASSS